MLMKTKEERSDILTNATMLMKTNGLSLIPHDMYESKGSYLKPQVENRDRGVPGTARTLFRLEAPDVETPESKRTSVPKLVAWPSWP